MHGEKHSAGAPTVVRAPAPEVLLGRRGVLLAVAGLEPGHAAAGVHDLLLARVERVAVAADVGVDPAGRRGAAGRELVAAAAGHQRLDVLGVNVLAQSRSSRILGRRVVAGGRPPREPEPADQCARHRVAPSNTRKRPGIPAAQLSSLLPGTGVVFCTCIRNSALDRVSFSLDSSSSSACWESSAVRTRRSFQLTASSSRPSRISSRRVPEGLTSTAGNSRLSARRRSSRSSMFPVPLNSSKITSSIFEPVSSSAVARMVSEPPFSMLRAAPKNRFGGYSALESTPPDRIRPLAGAARL